MADGRGRWYEVRAGRRHVVPYLHDFASYAKGRWIGRRVVDVMSDEFPEQCSAEYLAEAAATGRLTINGEPATAERTFRHGDRLVHSILRVEPSVPATPIVVLHEGADVLGLGKPAGVPVHHAGRYRRNSLVEILQAERPDLQLGRGNGGLHVLHRLDRQVSGVLLLPRSAAAAKALGAALQAGKMQKLYLARVSGRVGRGASDGGSGTGEGDAPLGWPHLTVAAAVRQSSARYVMVRNGT